MLATVAALVIVLGLAVSLARYVRRQASEQLTKDLLSRLDELTRRYYDRYKAVPPVPAFVGGAGGAEGEKADAGEGKAAPPLLLSTTAPGDDTLPPEAQLQQKAVDNNKAFVKAARVEARRRADEFGNLPPSFYDDGEGTLHDAWGTPIVFMPAMHPAVGMAMANRPFFLSAGPDRRFRTSEDNLYSYEDVGNDAK